MTTHIIIIEYLDGSVALGKAGKGTHLVGVPDVLHELGQQLLDSGAIKTYQLARLDNVAYG